MLVTPLTKKKGTVATNTKFTVLIHEAMFFTNLLSTRNQNVDRGNGILAGDRTTPANKASPADG